MTIAPNQSYYALLERLRRCAARGGVPKTMASPPTVTSSGTSTITGTIATITDTSKQRFWGGEARNITSTNWIQFRNVSYAGDGSTGAGIGGTQSFWTNAVAFEIVLRQSSSIRILVNGEYASSIIGPTGSGDTYVKVDFSSLSTTPTDRLIEVEASNNSTLAGVKLASIYDMWAPTPQDSPRLIIAGDSFTEGTGATVPGIDGYARVIGRVLGISDTWASGSGGTGWLQTNGTRVNLLGRWNTDVIARSPDLAIVTMGLNDGGQVAASLQTQVATAVTQFRNALPTKPLIITNGFNPRDSISATLRAAILAGTAVDTSGRTYTIDMSSPQRYMSVTSGSIASPAGTGNGDWMLATNSDPHPVTVGHDALGVRIAEAVKAILAAA